MSNPAFMIISERLNESLIKKLGFLVEYLAKFNSNLKESLRKSDINLNDKEYVSSALTSCLIYFLFLALLLSFIFFRFRGMLLYNSVLFGLAISFAFSVLLYLLLMIYPSILSRKKGEKIEKNLVFTLKDLLMQMESGVSINRAFFNISKGGYGEISKKFGKAVRDMNANVPVHEALKRLGDNVQSDYIRKVMWQIVNAINAGTSFKVALKNVIEDLVSDQKSRIKSYTQELNMWSLVYMIVAVALPTIGITIVIILSMFAGFGITKGFFIMFLILMFLIQFVIIGLVKSRRPVVEF